MSFKAYMDLVVKAYPAVGPFWKNTIESKAPLDEIRSQLWRTRAQFWYQKIGSIKPTWNQAKQDAAFLWKNRTSFGDMSYRTAAVGLVWGVQIYGCWKLGEIVARGHIGGYPVGDWAGAPHIKDQAH